MAIASRLGVAFEAQPLWSQRVAGPATFSILLD
jgi:hypothetical protein